jgi:hypothetical protein
MSRKRRKSGGLRFVMLGHYILQSQSWHAMPPRAKVLLIEVWRRHNGVNNGEISYSTREAAAALGCSNKTAARMFLVLIQHGFLAVVRASNFGVKIRVARTWRLTMERCGDANPTKDFMRWDPLTSKCRIVSPMTTSKTFPSVTRTPNSVTRTPDKPENVPSSVTHDIVTPISGGRTVSPMKHI